jgi:D-3-phosphoglycerate dehydrogenase / 2-oxoglutarate reductase
MKKILITPRSATRNGHPALARLEAAGYILQLAPPGVAPSEEDLLELLPGCVGYLAGVEPISAKVLHDAPGLRAISRNGTGADAIDLTAAASLGIKVLRTEGANARGVAELTLGLMLALARNLPATDQALKAGEWKRFPAMELEGKTLGLIGCGRIGRLVAGFALALGMQVLGYDLSPNWVDAPAGFHFADLDDVCVQADVLSLHSPPPAHSRPLLGLGELAKLKRGVLLINTSRAGLVDEEALLAALDSGQVAGLGLDVFDPEPPTDRRLLMHPRVIATPHIGAYTPESVDRAMHAAVENLLEALREV